MLRYLDVTSICGLTQRVGLKAERVVKVLDWCHAVHHVSLALAALGLPEQERQQQYRQMRSWLKAGRAFKVTAELSLLAEDCSPESKEIGRAHV